MKSPLEKKDRAALFSCTNYHRLTRLLKPLVHPLLLAGHHLPSRQTRCQQLMGQAPPLPPGSTPHLWIHGASLGEAGVTAALVGEIRAALKGRCHLTLSACTETGVSFLRKGNFKKSAVLFAPLDLPGWPEAALENRPPDIMVFVETEIWPNWIRSCIARGIPVLMVNGRISPRSFPRYMKIRPLLRELFSGMQAFSMISQADAARILALGAPGDRIRVCGNIKRDPALLNTAENPPPFQKKDMGIPETALIWVCGSVRKGEEGPLFAAFSEVKKAFPHLYMILAPRHLKRLRVMEKAASRAGLNHQRRSCGKPVKSEVLFLDTMGELRALYALADAVFCGGSLVPAGGQNLLEAAAWGKPVLFGPSMEDFTEEKNLLLAAGAAFEVTDSITLAARLSFLLRFPEKARAAGQAGLEALQRNQGALSCHARAILDLLPPEKSLPDA